MKLYFRPMPGLTIVTVIALAILISLGTWQYQRLQWKTELLADIDQAAEAPPFASFADVKATLDRGQPIDFRRIGVVGNSVEMARPPFLVFTPVNRDISWRVFRPVRHQGTMVFATFETIGDQDREDIKTSDAGIVLITGYVRLAREGRGKHTKSTPDKNRWFAFNPLPETHNWADEVVGGAETRFYVETVPGALDAATLPVRRPDIRNNHFDYMLTWYGLAVTLLIIYLLMHHRVGRLGRT